MILRLISLLVLVLRLISLQSLFDSSECLRFSPRRRSPRVAGRLHQSNDDDPSKLLVVERGGFSWPWPSPYLTNELAGDAGFDPFQFSKTREDLYLFREAEIKHCRIAMLGSLGWPVSELYHAAIAAKLNLPNLLQEGRVPSVLNGGLSNEYFLASLGGFAAVGAVLELELIRRKRETPVELRNFFDMFREDDWETPGNYRFDPLKVGKTLCGDDPSKKRILQSVEIFNGRMSMIACVGFIAQEAFTGKPLISQTPQFFGI